MSALPVKDYGDGTGASPEKIDGIDPDRDLTVRDC